MKQVQILIDSACDMQQPEADRLGVTLLPLRTSFDGEVFFGRRRSFPRGVF